MVGRVALGGLATHLHQLMPVLHGLARVGQHLRPVLAAVGVGGVRAHAAHADHLVVPDAGGGGGGEQRGREGERGGGPGPTPRPPARPPPARATPLTSRSLPPRC